MESEFVNKSVHANEVTLSFYCVSKPFQNAKMHLKLTSHVDAVSAVNAIALLNLSQLTFTSLIRDKSMHLSYRSISLFARVLSLLVNHIYRSIFVYVQQL